MKNNLFASKAHLKYNFQFQYDFHASRNEPHMRGHQHHQALVLCNFFPHRCSQLATNEDHSLKISEQAAATENLKTLSLSRLANRLCDCV